MVQKRRSSPLLLEKGYPFVDSQAQVDKPFALLLSDGNQLIEAGGPNRRVCNALGRQS